MFGRYESTFFQAVLASSAVVKDFQAGNLQLTTLAETKRDGTLVGECDVRSGEAGRAILEALPRDIFELKFEDVAGEINQMARYRVDNDNLDGTRPFTNGAMTSTVILGVFDKEKGQYVYCIVCEPISGRVWQADIENSTILRRIVDGELIDPEPIQVNTDDLNGKATIFLGPHAKGYSLNLEQYSNLVQNLLYAITKPERPDIFPHLAMLGSNGLHEALVANGAQGAVVGIMPAIGGPWDAAGVLLVIAAGGSAIGLSIYGSEVVEHNPLDPGGYNLLVFANNEPNRDKIVEIVKKSL